MLVGHALHGVRNRPEVVGVLREAKEGVRQRYSLRERERERDYKVVGFAYQFGTFSTIFKKTFF